VTTQKIGEIESNQSGFVIHMTSSSTRLIATDEVVQWTLLVAFSLDADLDLEVFEGTDLVRRVNAFDVNSKAKTDEISRIATQIDLNAGAVSWRSSLRRQTIAKKHSPFVSMYYSVSA